MHYADGCFVSETLFLLLWALVSSNHHFSFMMHLTQMKYISKLILHTPTYESDRGFQENKNMIMVSYS